MTKWHSTAAFMLSLALLRVPHGVAQINVDEPRAEVTNVDGLGLSTEQATALRQALNHHDYRGAESILLPEIQSAQPPSRRNRLLLTIAGIYFLNHDDLNAAIAWKKANAITPLPPPLQFSLSMAYIRMGKRDWAAQQLEKLTAAEPQNALYPYWLGRIDYDRQAYDSAIRHFQHAIQLDPSMARAYDNLGLCYSYLNRNALAVRNFEKAIALDSHAEHPSPWPHINLAATLQTMGDLAGAESHLREAARLDPRLASTHFELGNILDSMGKLQAAVDEYKQAAQLDPHYAEPHFSLARLYRRLGEEELSRREVETYRQLHDQTPSAANPH